MKTQYQSEESVSDKTKTILDPKSMAVSASIICEEAILRSTKEYKRRLFKEDCKNKQKQLKDNYL